MEKKLFEVAVAEASTELTATINNIQSKYGLPVCLMEGLVAASLAELRKGVLHELSFAYQSQQQEREKELVEKFAKDDTGPDGSQNAEKEGK